MRPVRVRFAPSPTGPLHIGGVRTALYNYLFAKQNGGTFVLRIEDTDQTRFVDGAIEYIIESLQWVGLIPDEGPGFGGDFGPYRQSHRRELYQKHATILVEKGYAYYAFDSVEELDRAREKSKATGQSFRYDSRTRIQMRNSLSLPEDEVRKLLANNTPHVLRLLIPADEQIEFSDHVRNNVRFQTNELDDKVILKTDGLPTYHLANVVDDYHMQISHVIRGEEWLSSTAHHVFMYKGFGWLEQMPEFVHLPLILKPTGKGKLSKRDGAKFGFPVFPLTWHGDSEEDRFDGFKEFGFDPAAVVNFLAFLGWNPGSEQEMFSLEELTEAFSLEGISKGGARFDFDKAKWYNQQYILGTDGAQLAALIKPLLPDAEKFDLVAYCNLMRERVIFINDFVTDGGWYFGEIEQYEEKMIRKKWDPSLTGHFKAICNLLGTLKVWSMVEIQNSIKFYMQESGLKFGVVLPLLRVALSGSSQGPDVFAMSELLGKDRTVDRLEKAIIVFNQTTQE